MSRWRDGLEQGYLVISVGRVVAVILSLLAWVTTLGLSILLFRSLFERNHLFGVFGQLGALGLNLLALYFGGFLALQTSKRLKDHRYQPNASRSTAVAVLIRTYADLLFIFGGAIGFSLLMFGFSYSGSLAPQLANPAGGYPAERVYTGIIPPAFLPIISLGILASIAILTYVLIFFLLGHALSALIEGVGDSASALKKLAADKQSGSEPS